MAINHFALLQSSIFSLRNGALYHRNGKASPSYLVNGFAKAIIQLTDEIQEAHEKGRLEYASRLVEDLLLTDRQVREFNLVVEVAKAMDTQRKQAAFAANNHL
jgi:hypothetical protein